jgi:hypothetical protein
LNLVNIKSCVFLDLLTSQPQPQQHLFSVAIADPIASVALKGNVEGLQLSSIVGNFELANWPLWWGEGGSRVP